MESLHAVLLGLVEGLTEFLPVSSTGHLILTSRLLRLPQTEFLKSFEIAIQLGAILAVVLLYGKRLLTDRKTLANVAAAFLPTAAIGFLLYKLVKQHLLGSSEVVLWALLIGGIVMLLAEWRWGRGSSEAGLQLGDMTPKHAVAVGLAQTLAVIPGVSRSGATVVGGLALGLSRSAIVEFSFLLAIPTMAAATGYDLLKTGASFSAEQWQLLAIGTASAFAVAVVAISGFLRIVRHGSFVPFAVYRIVLALAVFGLLA